MTRIHIAFGFCAFLSLSAVPAQPQNRAGSPQDVIALERAALDRWVKLDPEGYLGVYAPEVTYFDPQRDKRVDGLEAMKALLAPMKQIKAAPAEVRYEMIDPKVQPYGDVSVLTYNLVNFARVPGGQETVRARWNSTAVYARVGGQWKIVHSHWSYTKPELKPATP
jgi:ketosteroid isomerase-like protein